MQPESRQRQCFEAEEGVQESGGTVQGRWGMTTILTMVIDDDHDNEGSSDEDDFYDNILTQGKSCGGNRLLQGENKVWRRKGSGQSSSSSS